MTEFVKIKGAMTVKISNANEIEPDTHLFLKIIDIVEATKMKNKIFTISSPINIIRRVNGDVSKAVFPLKIAKIVVDSIP